MGRSSPLLCAVIFDWGGTLTPWHTVDLAGQWAVYARAVHGGDKPASAGLAARILPVEEAVHGSQKAGMRAIWVPHSTIPLAQQVWVDVVPDGVAHELIDIQAILAIVDGWRSS